MTSIVSSVVPFYHHILRMSTQFGVNMEPIFAFFSPISHNNTTCAVSVSRRYRILPRISTGTLFMKYKSLKRYIKQTDSAITRNSRSDGLIRQPRRPHETCLSVQGVANSNFVTKLAPERNHNLKRCRREETSAPKAARSLRRSRTLREILPVTVGIAPRKY